MALKIPPPIVALLIGFLMWLASRSFSLVPDDLPGSLPLTVVLAIAGAVVCGAGVASFLSAKTTVNPHTPERSSSLVVHGVYRYTRNPMYLGFALFLLAWAAWLFSLAALILMPLFVIYINRYQIAPEERALEATFGEEYLAYKRSVGRWLPPPSQG